MVRQCRPPGPRVVRRCQVRLGSEADLDQQEVMIEHRDRVQVLTRHRSLLGPIVSRAPSAVPGRVERRTRLGQRSFDARHGPADGGYCPGSTLGPSPSAMSFGPALSSWPKDYRALLRWLWMSRAKVSAASACIPGSTCWYTFIVNATLAWPSRSLTTFT